MLREVFIGIAILMGKGKKKSLAETRDSKFNQFVRKKQWFAVYNNVATTD